MFSGLFSTLPLPDYPALFWISAVVALILVGIAKAGFGGGIGVIATPLMALTIPVADAAALLLPLLIVMDGFAIRHYYKTFDRRSIVTLLPGAVVGIALGGLFFDAFADNERILRAGIGALALAFVAFQASRTLIFGQLQKVRMPTPVGVFIGAAGGFMSTIAHAGGPPVSIYVLPQRLPRKEFVGTTVVYFALVNLIKLVPYSALGLLRVGNLTTMLLLAPLCFVGVRLGIWLNGRINERIFNIIVYTLLFLTGLQLVIGRNLLSFIWQ